MRMRALLGLGAALAATTVGIVLLRPNEPAPTGLIYLLDARVESSSSFEPSPLVVKQVERRYKTKVLVRPAAAHGLLRDYQEMFKDFDRARGATSQSAMFFALAKPYTQTKKQLRETIDRRASLQGELRKQLLARLIVVRDTEGLSEGHECRQLGDDIAYATDNFLGIGLLIHDGTVQELEKCLATLAPEK